MFRSFVPLAALTLLALASRADAAPPAPHARAPMPVLVALETKPGPLRPARPSTAWQAELIIATDGRWVAGDAMGKLSRQDLTTLKRAVAKTRLVLARPATVNCDAIPNRGYRVRTTRGALTWAGPCGRVPSADVLALRDLARALVADAPVAPPDEPAPRPTTTVTTLVSYEEMRMTGPMDGTHVVVRSDGSYSAGTRSGVLTSAELAELEQLIRAAAHPSPSRPEPCAARLDGQATLSIGGGASYQFSIPCGWPQGEVGALLHFVAKLGRGAH